MKKCKAYFCFNYFFMRNLLLILVASSAFFTSCQNSAKGKTFCDTTCSNDSIKFTGNKDQKLSISIKSCKPEAIIWENKNNKRIIEFNDYINKDVKMNPSFVNCAFGDSSTWLSFNDCITGRGYLLNLPYSKNAAIGTYKAALNSFDKKFFVDPDLRAYTDGGNIYVVNVTNGNEAQMTFREAYQMDYDDIHKSIDSIHVAKDRIYVKLIKDGAEVPLEKPVSL